MSFAPAIPVRRQCTKGSVLILMLVVVLALATILMRIPLARHFQEKRDLRSRIQLAQAHEALLGFAIANGRLPRPARSVLDGHERGSDCTSEAECSGLLPWLTLGLTAADGWDHLLHYSVTPAMTQTPVLRDVVPSKVVLQLDAEGNEHYLAGQSECSQALLCSPAVIFTSSQSSGIHQTGLLQVGATRLSEIDQWNLGADQRFFLPTAAQSGSNAYGSQLRWLDAARLLRRMDDARQLH